LKKLLVALGLSSALLITPALAQTDQNAAPAAGATAPAADATKKPMKPKAHHHAKPKHVMKKSKAKPAKPAAPADANAPKT
jgi:hypothetical protein